MKEKTREDISEEPGSLVDEILRSVAIPEPEPLPIDPHPTPDVAVIGAGAAGLTAALRAAEKGARVVLFNAHPRIGLKILMSGGTRCNVTHEAVSERDFNGGSRNVIARILRSFDVAATLIWFEEELDVPLKLEESGKYFPVTDEAETVLAALIDACKRAHVTIESGARVVRLNKLGDGVFRIAIQKVHDSAEFDHGSVQSRGDQAWELPEAMIDRTVIAKRVILATGGLSFPRTGSDGYGYALAAALGHTIVPPVPALTPLTADDPLCKQAQGVTLDAQLDFWVGRKRNTSVRGSLLITHFGFSGPVALDLSRHWHRADGERRVTASFAPGATHESMVAAWLDGVRNAPERSVRRQLGRWVPERVAELLCREAEVDPAVPVPQVSRKQRAALLERLLVRDLHVTGTLGYEKAEVTAGGVDLSEVDASTLESRKCAGLYLCGEILDVEGRLGGFNFQWSWSSGTVAGRSAASS